MDIKEITLRQFLLRETAEHGLDNDLMLLLEDIATSCRIVSHQVRSGAFTQSFGLVDNTNVQGEDQKKLDVIANEVFVNHCTNCGRVAALVSEEIDDVIWVKKQPRKGDYIVYFDPLDGSSNLDINMSVGSIFSVIELDEDIDAPDESTVLRPGSEQICAGYAIYGSSTTFVVTCGHGVNGFTHQVGTGEFRLTHPDLRVPDETSEIAINASRYHHWDDPIRNYYDDCIAVLAARAADTSICAGLRPWSRKCIAFWFEVGYFFTPSTTTTVIWVEDCACFMRSAQWGSSWNRQGAEPPLAGSAS